MTPSSTLPTPTSTPIAIVGAGLVGRLTAWRLSLLGYSIHLFEASDFTKDIPKHQKAAAFTAAGMVAPYSEAVVSDCNVFLMGLYALARWPEWLADLPEGAEPYFFRKGSLAIAHPQDTQELAQFAHELKHIIPEHCDYTHLDHTQIHSLEPDLGDVFQHGLFLPNEGHIHNRDLMCRLGELLLSSPQITVIDNCQCHINGTEITNNLDSTQKWQFEKIIDCRGFGAKRQSSAIRGVRGETLYVETREISLSRPVRLMHPRYQLYIVPKPHNIFMIGATQIESEDQSPVSLLSSLELSSALYTLSPAFAEARILELDTNLRPAYIDNMPHIDCEGSVITANGLFRHGYLLAPAIVDNLVGLITGIKAQFHELLVNSYKGETND